MFQPSEILSSKDITPGPGASTATIMLWDPFNAWPVARWWLWGLVTAWVVFFMGPYVVSMLRPSTDQVADFFQEWSSARNYLLGEPVYTNLRISIKRELGWEVQATSAQYMGLNTHPPTSILLALPLAWLDYPNAMLVWNLLTLAGLGVSLWLVVRGLDLPVSVWAIFPLVTLLLLSGPFRLQVMYGQLTLMLVLLVTGTWATARAQHHWVAGVLLALAMAIKLFPGFLFLFFVVRRQWQTVVAGAITLIVLTALTVAILGVDTYQSYVHDVLPRLHVYLPWLNNASLAGFWSKLFTEIHDNVDAYRMVPLWENNLLARGLTMLSYAVLLGFLVPVIWRARTRAQFDCAFALILVAMLLVGPYVWEHYHLLLLLPLAVVWMRLAPRLSARITFLLIIMALWMPLAPLWSWFIPGGLATGIAEPVHSVTIFSMQCYALLALFAMCWITARQMQASGTKSVSRTVIAAACPERPLVGKEPACVSAL